jgi:hypothetical protein
MGVMPRDLNDLSRYLDRLYEEHPFQFWLLVLAWSAVLLAAAYGLRELVEWMGRKLL